MLSSLDPSRNWSAGLNRLGFGALAIYALVETDPLPLTISDVSPELGNFSEASALITVFAFFVAASIIGTICISLGYQFSFGPVLNEKRMLERALKMGGQENPFVVSLYRDARLQFELASGILGTALFVTVGVFVVVGYSKILGVEQAANSSKVSQWILLYFSVCVSCLVVLMYWAVVRSFKQLDSILFVEVQESRNA